MFSKHAAEGAIIWESLPKSAPSDNPEFDFDIDITVGPGQSCTIKIENGGSSRGRVQQQIETPPRVEGVPTFIPADKSRHPTPESSVEDQKPPHSRPGEREQQSTTRNPTAGSQSLLDHRGNAADKHEGGDQETCKRQENTDKEPGKHKDETDEDNKNVTDSGEKPLENEGETSEGEMDDDDTVSGTEDIDGQKVNSKRVGDDEHTNEERPEIIDLTNMEIDVEDIRHFYTIKVSIPDGNEPFQTIIPIKGLPEKLQKHKAQLPLSASISEVLATPESTAAGVHSQNKRQLNKKKPCAIGEVSA